MAAMTNSPAWQDLQRAAEEQHEAEKDHPEPVNIILDCPGDDECTQEQFSLFLIMSSFTKSFHEGLVLIRADNSGRFRRVGFFTTKLDSVFDDAGLVDVELI